MFEDTDLPLALIMEEILEWEKKSEQKENETENGDNQEVSSTYKEF